MRNETRRECKRNDDRYDNPIPLPPVAEAASAAMTDAPSQTAGRLAGRTILVAEDNAIIAMDLQTILESQGVAIIGPWSTVADALDAVAKGGIDAALLDVDLQDGDALPVIEALAERHLPIVLTTGHDISGRLPQAFASLPLVAKPFVEADIVAALEAALWSEDDAGD